MNLENKYRICNLVNAVKCRKDRCGLERILGLLFTIEYDNYSNKLISLFGEIFNHYKAFNYNYD